MVPIDIDCRLTGSRMTWEKVSGHLGTDFQIRWEEPSELWTVPFLQAGILG